MDSEPIDQTNISKFESFKELIVDFFRVCVGCGSFLKKSKTPFCKSCSVEFLRFKIPEFPFFITLNGFAVFAHLVWKPNDLLLSKLVLRLKGASCPQYWRWMARSFLTKRGSLLTPKPGIIVIAPSHSVAKDHAYYWGLALSEISGVPLVSCLTYPINSVQGAQKSKSKKERLNIVFNSSESFSTFSGRIIFADDVITTGATALAAYKALGCPAQFEVWALVHRSLTCEIKNSLL